MSDRHRKTHPSLRPISPNTRAALEQGASLTSPWQCVEQLVLNSLDAGATSIAVRADLAPNNLWLQVADDGSGLGREELKVVGRLHWSGSDGRGRSLAALRRVAKGVAIRSTSRQSCRTFSVNFEQGRRSPVLELASSKRSSGTKVTVSGFLWNRESRRLAVREIADLSKLKRGLMAFALARPGIRISLRRDSCIAGTEQLLCIKRHVSAAGVWREALEGMHEADLAESTLEVDYQEEVDVSVTGVFCGNAHGSRRLQFISVEGCPLERGVLHLAVEKLCKKAFRFQDNHSLAKRFPAYALHIHPRQNNMTQARIEEVLLSTVASVLDQLGILQLPEIKRSRICSASIAMTGIKPLPSTQRLTAPSHIIIDPPPHCSSLLLEQLAPEQLPQEPCRASRSIQPSTFSFTPAVLGGRTSKPVYCRPPPNNDLSLPRMKRVVHPQNATEGDRDVHPEDDGTAQVLPLPDNLLCSTLQEEPECHETLRDNSVRSEDQLVHLDLSFQDVFVEEEQVDASSSAISKERVLDEGSENFPKSPNEDVTEGKAREPLDEFKNDQPDLFVKPTNSNVAEDNSGETQEAEEECGALELSLGSDFSERHVASFGLIRAESDGDMVMSKSWLVKDNNEVNEGGSGEDNPSAASGRVSAILKGWVNPQFAPHCSPLKLKQLPGLDTECQITRGQLKDALFIGQVDEKFLATVCGGLLVLWDQHAVHERVRLERLLAEALVEGSPGLAVKSAACPLPLVVSLPKEEASLVVESGGQLLGRWGVQLAEENRKVTKNGGESSLVLSHIPHCFLSTELVRQVELCRALLLEVASSLDENSSSRLPRALQDHLASQACRGAIMFGKKLGSDDCRRLLTDLALCEVPFQCAHGRPSCATIHRLDA